MRTIIRLLAQLSAICVLSISANASVIYEFEATETQTTVPSNLDSIWGSFKLTLTTYVSVNTAFDVTELDSSTIAHTNSSTSISLSGVGFIDGANNYIVFYTTHSLTQGAETYWWLPDNAFTAPGTYYSGTESFHNAVLTVRDTERAVPEPSTIGLLFLAVLGILPFRRAAKRLRNAT